MKLQVAINRVSLTQAKQLIEEINKADIIEIGTSLSKDYGLDCIRQTKDLKKEAQLLVDIKTIDEGEYEFRQYFEAGADILTVMGASAPETIEICCKVAEEYDKEVLIDLLECSEEKIDSIAHHERAIYGMHFAKDSNKEVSVVEEVLHFSKKFPQIKRIALAGSLDFAKVRALTKTNLEVAIVGSSIIKSKSPRKEVSNYLEAIR